MKKIFLLISVCLIITSQVKGQADNGNKFKQVWNASVDDFKKGYLVNAGMDMDGDGWGEFLLWDATTQTNLLYEAYGDDHYRIVYRDNELLNFFDLDRDGQLELVKIHQDSKTLEQWMTVHEWNGKNFDASLAGGFSEATKTTNRFPRAFWYGIAEGHGFDRGLWDFKNFDGDQDWDILSVDAKLTSWGGQIVRWNEGTIFNILEMTNFDTATPKITLRYTSGSIGGGMLFFGLWNSYIDVDKDGLLDNVFVSDHAQSVLGIRTAGNDSYAPIVVTRLPDRLFYHLPTWPVVANFDNDQDEEIYFADLDGQFWYMQNFGDFETMFQEFNIFYLTRIVKKQNTAGATNMCVGGHLGDQDGDGKPDIYYFSKDIKSLIDVEYQGGFAGDSASFTYTYTNLFFSNGEPMNGTMWHMQTGARYGNPLLDMDHDGKRELIIGGPDTDNMVTQNISTLYILESEHTVVTAVEKSLRSSPENFQLCQNYPNPFNPETTIRFSLSKPSQMTVRIVDINGKLVRNLFSGSRSCGTHSLTWNARDDQDVTVSSGVYFCVCSSPEFNATRKMIFMK
jgi:hypothetical protein